MDAWISNSKLSGTGRSSFTTACVQEIKLFSVPFLLMAMGGASARSGNRTRKNNNTIIKEKPTKVRLWCSRYLFSVSLARATDPERGKKSGK